MGEWGAGNPKNNQWKRGHSPGCDLLIPLPLRADAPCPALPLPPSPRLQARSLNVPSAGYEKDGALMEQLRQVKSSMEMKAFLEQLLQAPKEPRPEAEEEEEEEEA